MDYPKECKNQMGTGFDSIVEEPLQVRMNRRISQHFILASTCDGEICTFESADFVKLKSK